MTKQQTIKVSTKNQAIKVVFNDLIYSQKKTYSDLTQPITDSLFDLEAAKDPLHRLK